MVTYSGYPNIRIEPTHPMGSEKVIKRGDTLILSPDIKEGDFVIRFKDDCIGGDWFTGICGRQQKDKDYIIFRNGMSCGQTRNEIWYKIVYIMGYEIKKPRPSLKSVLLGHGKQRCIKCESVKMLHEFAGEVDKCVTDDICIECRNKKE